MVRLVLTPVPFSETVEYHGAVEPYGVQQEEKHMDPVQVVQGQVDAFNARDAERFVSFYSPDAVLQDGAGNVIAQGNEAIQAVYAQLFAQSPDLHVDILKRIHVGSWVIDEEQATGFILEGFPPEVHAPIVYRIEDGKIIKVLALF
jgi:hypothetical protein